MNNVYNGDFLDFSSLNDTLIKNNVNQKDKLKAIHTLVGGEFADENIISKPVVKIYGIGGIPIVIENKKVTVNGGELTKGSLKKMFNVTAGASSFMSYLNPSNKDLTSLGESVVNKYKHLSVLHSCFLNIFISGISIGVEHEISSQRDLVHLSRLTVARTSTQSSPCLVLSNMGYLEEYKKIDEKIKEMIGEMNFDKNDHEIRNLLYPTAKASAIMLSGSLRNILKIADMMNSDGKENEFIIILEELDRIIKDIY